MTTSDNQKNWLPQWIHSIRAWAVFLVFGLLYIVVVMDKIQGSELNQLITFIVGLVLGAYFGKRDPQENPQKEQDPEPEPLETVTRL